MRPDFGCALRSYLMEPNTPATREGIARGISAAIRFWEPRVELGAVDVTPTDEPSAVLVSVTYTLVRDQSVDAIQVVVPVDASARERLT
jgi:phage baseplate assembly protein W